MTEYQKTYIELKKQFVATNEGPDNVRALYTFLYLNSKYLINLNFSMEKNNCQHGK